MLLIFCSESVYSHYGACARNKAKAGSNGALREGEDVRAEAARKSGAMVCKLVARTSRGKSHRFSRGTEDNARMRQRLSRNDGR